jgi:hypothetical protein
MPGSRGCYGNDNVSLCEMLRRSRSGRRRGRGEARMRQGWACMQKICSSHVHFPEHLAWLQVVSACIEAWSVLATLITDGILLSKKMLTYSAAPLVELLWHAEVCACVQNFMYVVRIFELSFACTFSAAITCAHEDHPLLVEAHASRHHARSAIHTVQESRDYAHVLYAQNSQHVLIR